MNATKHEAKIAIATLILIGCALSLSMLTQVMSSMQANTKISNQGALKTVGVGVYGDSGLTNKVSSIDWGFLEPNENKTMRIYVKSIANVPSTLTLSTENWIPSNASLYMGLSWNYNGLVLNPNDVVPIDLTLSVSPSISGITSFSFDITIIASA